MLHPEAPNYNRGPLLPGTRGPQSPSVTPPVPAFLYHRTGSHSGPAFIVIVIVVIVIIVIIPRLLLLAASVNARGNKWPYLSAALSSYRSDPASRQRRSSSSGIYTFGYFISLKGETGRRRRLKD